MRRKKGPQRRRQRPEPPFENDRTSVVAGGCSWLVHTQDTHAQGTLCVGPPSRLVCLFRIPAVIGVSVSLVALSLSLAAAAAALVFFLFRKKVQTFVLSSSPQSQKRQFLLDDDAVLVIQFLSTRETTHTHENLLGIHILEHRTDDGDFCSTQQQVFPCSAHSSCHDKTTTTTTVCRRSGHWQSVFCGSERKAEGRHHLHHVVRENCTRCTWGCRSDFSSWTEPPPNPRRPTQAPPLFRDPL